MTEFSRKRTLGPDLEHIDPTDALDILGRFDSYLEGIDLARDGEYESEGRRIQVQNGPSNESGVWVWEEGVLIAIFRKEIDRTTRAIFGKTRVAESPIRAELVTYSSGNDHVSYYLRGEEVRDDHRVGVVRKGFSFVDLS